MTPSSPDPAPTTDSMQKVQAHPSWKGRSALAIDTSSEVLSLALLVRGELAGSVYEALGRGITGAILPRLDALLQGAAVRVQDLEALVVARGPGSFTGTRIGLGVAQTFALVTGLPLLGIDSLQLLAMQVDGPALAEQSRATADSAGEFHVLLNSVRNEVYHARYRWLGEVDGAPQRLGEITLADMESLRGQIGNAPVVLRRFPTQRGEARPPAEAPFNDLVAAPLRHPQPDGTLLLRAGLMALGESTAHTGEADEDPTRPDGLEGYPATPIYLKSEAFRTWPGNRS